MKKNLIIIFSLSIVQTISAQDALFTQYKSAGSYYTLGNVGHQHSTRINLIHRNQWPGIDAKLHNNFIHADHTFNSSTIGTYYLRENTMFGNIQHDQVAVSFSKKFIISQKIQLGFGIRGQYFKTHVNTGYFPIIVGTGNKSGLDWAAGISLNISRWYINYALDHITEPEYGIIGPHSTLTRKNIFQTGYIFYARDKKMIISPSLFVIQQGSFIMSQLSISARYKGIIGGFAYRTQDAYIALVGLHRDKFSLVYSYDITTSKLGLSTPKGSHEVSLNIQLKWKKEE